LESEISQLKEDVKSLRGAEKDDMKAYIKSEENMLSLAELEVRQGNKATVEIGDRLVAAQDLLAEGQAEFDGKKAIHDANEIDIKDEARAAVVDVYNQLESDIYELDDMIDRYYSERDFDKVDELSEERYQKW
jgi:TolA-binding protein